MSPTKVLVEKLTPEQEAQLPVWRDRWREYGLSTEPADRPRAEAALRAMYREIGEAEPQFLWLDSPASAALARIVFKNLQALNRGQLGGQLWGQLGGQLWGQLGGQLGDQLWGQLGGQLGDQLGDQLRDQLWGQLRDQLRGQLRGQLGDQLRDQLWDQLRDQLWGQLRGQLGDQLRDQLRGQLRDQQAVLSDFAGWGSWEWWIPFYVYPRDVLGLEYPIKESRRLNLWVELMQACGWWMPFRGLVIVCERPMVIERDGRGRLHCPDGPALAFRDDYAVWAWHGVRVPREVIEQPDSLTPERVLGETNAEVRRVMIERFGAARLMEAGKGQKIHADDFGTLWRINLTDDEPVVMVEVVNSTPEPDGSFLNYWLRVPPDMQTARQAVLWTHDLPADAEPVVMT